MTHILLLTSAEIAQLAERQDIDPRVAGSILL